MMQESLFRIISSHVERNPDAVALLAPEQEPMTYAALLNKVRYLGGVLDTSGLKRSDRVAVVLPNGPEMAAVFLGTASYFTCAPLNPSYRAEEFEFYLKDLEAKAVVVLDDANSAVREVAKNLGIKVFPVSPSESGIAGDFNINGFSEGGIENLDDANGQDVALVLHTSGTTSRPKQVPLTHSNLCTSAGNVANAIMLSPRDRCLNIMPLFHIHGLVGALLSSIVSGGSIVCSSGYEEDLFARLMLGYCPTWYSAVPTMHQSILALAKKLPEVAASGALRCIRSSSSALPPTVMADLERTFGTPVIESYGMTEASHQMASNPLPPGARKPGSVGLPAGPDMAIMDENGLLLEAGQTGEIVIRGKNVTRGYVNNPEANETSFTAGWFRTGDLGCTDGDGYFFITGRKKEMINRGGENISPREIDEALLEHPDVAQAVAFAAPHPTLGEDVVVAVILREGATCSEQELREFLFDRLSDFKVPSQVLQVAEIPKGPTGKLKRIGLHSQLKHLLRSDYVAPSGSTEQRLAEFWKELLDLSEVGRNDNFFMSGGDSLLATRLAARLRADLDVELSLPALFRQPTLRAQAGLIDTAIADAENARLAETMAFLDELESLSDEEAARLLAEQGGEINRASSGTIESTNSE